MLLDHNNSLAWINVRIRTADHILNRPKIFLCGLAVQHTLLPEITEDIPTSTTVVHHPQGIKSPDG